MARTQPHSRPVVVRGHLAVAYVDGDRVCPANALGELTGAGLMEAAARLGEILDVPHEAALQKLAAAWRAKTRRELMPDNMVGL